jgi:hypothetical protein
MGEQLPEMKQILVVLLLCGIALGQKKTVTLKQAADRVFAEQCRDNLRRDYQSLQEPDTVTAEQFAAIEKRAKDCLAIFVAGSPQAVVAVTLASVEREKGRRAVNAAIDKHAESYNSLVRDYNSLLADYRLAVSYSYNARSSPPVVIPQPRQPLNCMAMRLGDNLATLNCY